jgi:hypothetical protein
VFLVVDLDLGAGVLADQDAVPLLHVQRELLAVLVDLALAHGDHLGLHRLLFRGVGDDDAALARLLLLDPLDQNPVVKRTNLHSYSSCQVLRIAPGTRSVTGRDNPILALLVVEC